MPASASDWPDALFTNLYERSMLQAYAEEGMAGEAVFSQPGRRLPARRNYLLACGIESELDFLKDPALYRQTASASAPAWGYPAMPPTSTSLTSSPTTPPSAT